MGYIYKIINDINEKVYIGQTKETLSSRFSKHCWDAQNKAEKHSHLHAAIRKYGAEHFSICQVEECPNENLDDREKFWISYYDSYSNGYNATLGGDGNFKIDSKEVVELWSLGNNQKEIAAILGCERHAIKKHLLSSGYNQEELQQKKMGNAAKSVVQIDPKSKEIIAVYTSATEAAIKTNSSLSGISLVCNNKRKTHNGYIWKYS